MSSLSESYLASGITLSQSPLVSDGVILRTWLAQQQVDYYRPASYTGPSQLQKDELQAMRTFGGEPGEDCTLIGKMQEMFDSMDWVTV